jgi:SAM-dependent methyltransferase
MTVDTTSELFFERKYRENSDPWNFSKSDYEQRRYDAIVRNLGGRRYRRAFEPGCSVGALTARLAAICDEVIAGDISTTAVDLAKERCKHLKNVSLAQLSLPDSLPAGKFDLIVFSEIGYYFSEPALATLSGQLMDRFSGDGLFLACHWLGASRDHVLTGDRVHEILSQIGGVTHLDTERHSQFRLDTWGRQ